MIKQAHGTELTSCKTRSGLSSVSDLIPRLIRSYELQAELLQRRAERAQQANTDRPVAATPVQATFGWEN